jgi:ketosteroid isomerase-like protein
VGAAEVGTVLRFWQILESSGSPDGLLHDEVEVHDFDLPDAGVYRGRNGFAQWLADWSEPWDDYRGEILDVFDLGDQVASEMHLTARTMSNLEVEREDSQLVTVREGRITKVEYFGDPDTALERAADAARGAARRVVHDKVRAVYRAGLHEDVETAVAQLGPDYEFYPEAGAPMAPAYRGAEGARAYFREVFEAWEILSFDVERLLDVGDSVLALFEMRNRGRGSGAELTGRWAEIWQTRGQELIASRFYQTHDEALAAAGLA